MEDTKIDILGLVETNVLEKEGKLMLRKVQGYYGFWSSADEDKVKGSGVGIIINSKWENHVAKVEKISLYILSVTMFLSELVLKS